MVQVFAKVLSKNLTNLEIEDDDKRQYIIRKAATYFFMTMWHSFATIGLVYCVWGKPWLPTYMGGNGSFSAGFTDIPF